MNSFVRRPARAAGVVAVAATFLLGAAGSAVADNCLEAAFGGDTNCTANDFTVSSVQVLNVDQNDCGGVTNTFTFDGEFTVDAGSADRYDVGFYVGSDGSQALTGTGCFVSIIPPDVEDDADDGDDCGDYGGVAIVVPVQNVTVTCNDSDGDGFFDLPLCTAWSQNGNEICTSPADAIPGTSSKCDCNVVNTDVEIPQCANNAECADDGNVCTDSVCVGIGEPGADNFGCANVNNTAPCDDGLFCNGTDVCADGACGHSGDPCVGGGVCGDECNEAADNCFVLAGTTCRATAGVCDQAETCTGSNADCPADDFLDAGVCRESAGTCDVAESCDGASADCPVDGFANEGSLCRASAGDCDVAETCTGSSAACPGNDFVDAGTLCRASAGECDVPETCTGSSATCPGNGFVDAGTLCRASAGECDAAETCTGSSATCPGDGFANAGTLCRASAGECDAAETCTGSSATCPGDGFANAGTLCRGSAGECDVAETCSGSSASCPDDGFAAADTLCRGAAGECDVAEQCTGTSAACPDDAFVADGVACTSDGNVCTDDECDGSGNCGHDPNTDPCNDGAFCTQDDTCSGGTCSGDPVACDDGIACTDDSCDEGQGGCVAVENDSNCNDDDTCTADSCSIDAGGCLNEFVCGIDICRSPGYWSTHSGYEKSKAVNVGQELLDLRGPFEVCGQVISTTSNPSSPYLDGLGLTSSLEGLCMRTRGEKQRQLYRQLVAAKFNCELSGASDCDAITDKYIEVSWNDCSDLCAGNPLVDPPSVNECISQLDCFNNGGQIVDGQCAKGTCEAQPEIFCGGDHGSCPDYLGQPQGCERFPGNCHEQPLCNEGMGFCPNKTPASSPWACREARKNGCTIDSCF